MVPIRAGNVDCGRGNPVRPSKQLNPRRISEIMNLLMPNALPIVAKRTKKKSFMLMRGQMGWEAAKGMFGWTEN
jgi:hypothetical protein